MKDDGQLCQDRSEGLSTIVRAYFLQAIKVASFLLAGRK